MDGYEGISTISFKDAEIGDIILQETNDDVNDGPDHTGIFLSYSNGEVEYISGNSSNSVKIRKCSPSEFHGICKPDFEQGNMSSKKNNDKEKNEKTTEQVNSVGLERSKAKNSKTESTTSYTTEETTEETTSSKKYQSTKTTTEQTTVSGDIRVYIGSNLISVGDEIYETDAYPYIQEESNSTLIPLRFVSIAIISGIDAEISKNENCITWDPVTKSATICANGRNVKFTAGSSDMIVNDTILTMDKGVKAEIKDGRLFIPFRALGTALGVNVDWDPETKAAIYKVR